ncbi:hypothetical protein BY996DRAFT_7130589, partial [Phakopsora pachyrhizi]
KDKINTHVKTYNFFFLNCWGVFLCIYVKKQEEIYSLFIYTFFKTLYYSYKRIFFKKNPKKQDRGRPSY